ncbi:hypothetical protein L198_05640 [Cryptococcus wingfieldii CBS 7118]|uniref:Uncharacterized protein n=1 Tax=Cryptococcus wingfieldii CBS 7118 TaxID=1295528 RepID=A0A1E3IW48_9TREE|nr:hypothetical protein L198_05640 [Cryptococcus wingfieldii CBS 7118]ODN92843.1 hypothetical protein L198_05640 [Cryptococcus wingfieldii CBS 7118]
MPVTVNEPSGESHPLHHRKHHYTFRKSPYLVSLAFLLVATALTLLNIHVPQLIHVVGRSPGPTQFETRYGTCTRSLASSPNTTALLLPAHPLPHDVELPMPAIFDSLPSSSLVGGGGIEGPIGHPAEGDGHEWVCQDFPTRSECEQFGEKFCVLWSTAGYAAQSSLVPCLASLLSLLFIFLHRARRQQWKLVSVTMLIHCLLQVLSIGMILHVFRTDERFESKGSHLDKSFSFGVSSALVSLTHALFLTLTAYSARLGHSWAAGKSAKKSRRHRRTHSGRVVLIEDGVEVPVGERVTVGEARVVAGEAGERTGLLEGDSGEAAGGGRERATDSAV